MGDWDISSDIFSLDEMERDFRKEIQELCDSAAESVLVKAKEKVPQPGRSRGYATGALRESGYSKNPFESGYAEAISRAKSAPDTRIEIRGQIEPELWLDQHDADSFISAVHFPLDYADLIRFGFYHTGAGRQIPGDDFLQSALTPVERGFNRAANRVVKYVMAKHSR